MEGLAQRLLEVVAAGKPVRMRDAMKLASAVLSSPEVELAEQVLEGGAHQLSRALELAGIVVAAATSEAARGPRGSTTRRRPGVGDR